MRVITGTARGRRLKELEGTETRPTTARVKAGLFSALEFDIEGRRAAKGMEVAVTQDGREVVRKRLRAGQSLGVTLE